MKVAYWITPDCQVIPVISSHIETIIDHPDIFHVPLDQITSAYAKHHEVVRTEGKAREEIIIDVVKKGFVRVRRYTHPREEYWSINVNEINADSMDLIQQFFGLICQGEFGCQEIDHEIPVVITAFNGHQRIRLAELVKDNHLPTGQKQLHLLKL
jgi:hypothetical protein